MQGYADQMFNTHLMNEEMLSIQIWAVTGTPEGGVALTL